jgi:heparinase II/III-like protein
VSTPPIIDAPSLLPATLAVEPLITPAVLRRAGPRRFFSGASDGALRRLLIDRFPDDSDAAVAAARAFLDSGTTHLVAPALTAQSRRQQSLIRLAQAYVLTGDVTFATACLSAVETWVALQDVHSAPRAADPDAGFRLIAWCWALVLLRDTTDLDDTRVVRIAAAIHQETTRLSATLGLHTSPATQITTDALTLFYVSTVFAEFPESRRWRDLATRVLVAECERQVHPDGVHFEQSTCFQRYAIDVYLHFLLLAARNDVSVPPLVAERTQRMLDFVLSVRMPDGTVPSIGDSDGGSLLPLAPRSTSDPRGRFAVASVLFRRADFAWAAGGATSEVAWLFGSDGVAAFDALRPSAPTTAPSRVFPSGGYVVMRSGWDRDAHHMVVDVGTLGCPVSSAHGHADLLSIQCAIFGEPIIVDPGTHSYGGDSRWRDFFRSTAAHSTIVIDGISQAEPSGSIGWQRRPRVRLREWHSTTDVDFLDAEHDGYARLPHPVIHRRRVIFIKPSYWIVVDDLSGSGRHDVDLTFQFVNAEVAFGPHPWTRAATSTGQCLWISPFPSAPAQPTLKCGVPAPIRGWISPEFTRLSPAPMLIYSFAVALPWRIVTLLLPDRQGMATPPGVRPIYDAGGLPHGFVFDRPRRVVRFDDRAVLVERD